MKDHLGNPLEVGDRCVAMVQIGRYSDLRNITITRLTAAYVCYTTGHGDKKRERKVKPEHCIKVVFADAE